MTQRLVDSGTPVEAGTVVATIDLQPMVLASGDVPAFRDLRVGATGADVEQLQAFLAEQGWLDASGIDGRYQAATRNAVRSWQEHLTISTTGEVPLGHLLFVLELRVRLRWTADVGDVVQPGQPLADLLEAFPRFVAEIDRRTFSDVPAGGAVTVTGPSASTWPAHLGTVLDLGPDLATVAVVADQPGCGSPCEDVGLEGVTRFSGQVVLEEERSGPVVPAAAVTVNAAGQHVVHVQGRGQVMVEVLAEADGQVVVSGIEVGDRVELPPERR